MSRFSCIIFIEKMESRKRRCISRYQGPFTSLFNTLLVDPGKDIYEVSDELPDIYPNVETKIGVCQGNDYILSGTLCKFVIIERSLDYYRIYYVIETPPGKYRFYSKESRTERYLAWVDYLKECATLSIECHPLDI